MFPIFHDKDFKNADLASAKTSPKLAPSVKHQIIVPEELEQKIREIPDVDGIPGFNAKCVYLIEEGLRSLKKNKRKNE